MDETQRLRALVFNALDHARENGYTFEQYDHGEIAADLTDYDSDLEHAEPAALLPHVQAWFRAYGGADGEPTGLVW